MAVHSEAQTMEALEAGLANRVVASTAMNAAAALNCHAHKYCFVTHCIITNFDTRSEKKD